MGSLIACVDATLRRVGGVPAYLLGDNAKTVTVEHVAGVAVRHPTVVAAGRHYGATVYSCEPFDPESKGGVEATVRVAKADLVPKETNLRGAYGSFAELVAACQAWCEHINARVHRETAAAPVHPHPPRPPRPRPRTKAEVDFLDIGEGALAWLVEAAATGATRVRAKMARAVEFATIMGTDKVDHALGLAAAAGRFDEHDLGSILDHLATRGDPGALVRADETYSAQPGTSSWERLGR